MTVFSSGEFRNHEQVVFCSDKATGLKGIIAIHNTKRGPAVGGCRMWPYASEEEALTDVLRLSRGMTYKTAILNLNYGGGKSIIIGDPKKHKSQDLLRAMASFVESLGGKYIIAEDVGISDKDVETFNQVTDHVTGLPSISGDPSPATAFGVYHGIKASVQYKLGRDNLSGLKVSVQGTGKVGFELCRLLHEAGAKLFVSDIHEESLQQAKKLFNAQIVDLDEIYGLDVDIYAPCALGAVVNDKTIDQFKAKIIAGSANNQLDRRKHGDILHEKDILYVPDYVINAGGVINISEERPFYSKERAYNRISKIYNTLLQIYQRAEQDNIPPYRAADELAEERFATQLPRSGGTYSAPSSGGMETLNSLSA